MTLFYPHYPFDSHMELPIAGQLFIAPLEVGTFFEATVGVCIT